MAAREAHMSAVQAFSAVLWSINWADQHICKPTNQKLVLFIYVAAEMEDDIMFYNIPKAESVLGCCFFSSAVSEPDWAVFNFSLQFNSAVAFFQFISELKTMHSTSHFLPHTDLMEQSTKLATKSVAKRK